MAGVGQCWERKGEQRRGGAGRGDGGRAESGGEEEEEEGAEEAAEARDSGEQTDSFGLGVEELGSDSDSVGISIACSPWRNRAAATPRSSIEVVRHRSHAIA